MPSEGDSGIEIPDSVVASQCLYSLIGRMSYRTISRSIEAVGFDFRLFKSLCNLTGTSPAALLRYLSNLRATRSSYHPISRLHGCNRHPQCSLIPMFTNDCYYHGIMFRTQFYRFGQFSHIIYHAFWQWRLHYVFHFWFENSMFLTIVFREQFIWL